MPVVYTGYVNQVNNENKRAKISTQKEKLVFANFAF